MIEQRVDDLPDSNLIVAEPANGVEEVVVAAPGPDLPELVPEVYINRELSWLEFNRRVLREVAETPTPLIERAKFAAIF
ncbi:MAG TPA: hypothetical protein VFQ54_03440, partial [Thermomicrobiales bacterium]|nr:hypothetical protein [Thermomicrobiales bacterium]